MVRKWQHPSWNRCWPWRALSGPAAPAYGQVACTGSPASGKRYLAHLTFQAEAYLEKVRAYLKGQGVEVTCAVCVGEPACEIVDFAERQGVDSDYS